MTTILPKSFFNREADVVARELIGHVLCVRTEKGTKRHVITETEAYMGPHDLACHASKGKTMRTEVLYKDAGTLYVYFIYGMYEMLNIVTGESGYPAAVLLRGAGPYDGPGKLTRALAITRKVNGAPMGRKAGIWIEVSDKPRRQAILATPRIGVGYAKEWADAKLRFVAHS